MFKILFLAIGLTYLYYQTPWGEDELAKTRAETIQANEIKKQAIATCTGYGIAYFKEIGSYPYLSTGQDAELVAEARCERTYNPKFKESTAFSKPEPICADPEKRKVLRKRWANHPDFLKELEIIWKEQDKDPACKRNV